MLLRCTARGAEEGKGQVGGGGDGGAETARLEGAIERNNGTDAAQSGRLSKPISTGGSTTTY